MLGKECIEKQRRTSSIKNSKKVLIQRTHTMDNKTRTNRRVPKEQKPSNKNYIPSLSRIKPFSIKRNNKTTKKLKCLRKTKSKVVFKY